MTLVANPDYYAGRAPLKALEFVYIVDPNALWDTFKQDDVTMAILRDPIVVEEALTEKVPGYLQMVGLGVTGLVNSREGYPGHDVRVRRAIQMALDPELVNERANEGAGVVSSSLFPNLAASTRTGWRVCRTTPRQRAPLSSRRRRTGSTARSATSRAVRRSSAPSAWRSRPSSTPSASTTKTEFLASITDLITRVVVDGDYDMSTWGLSWRDSAPYARMFGINHSGPAASGTAPPRRRRWTS